MEVQNLSDTASQQLKEVHSLVIRFQSLEDDLRDTFKKLQSEHDSEIQRLQMEIRAMKGIEETQTNSNPYAYATQLKQNPLNAQNSQRLNNNHPGGSISVSQPTTPSEVIQQKMQINHSIKTHNSASARNTGAAQPQQKYHNIPSPIAPSPKNGYRGYQQPSDRKSRSHGMGFVPPPPTQPPPKNKPMNAPSNGTNMNYSKSAQQHSNNNNNNNHNYNGSNGNGSHGNGNGFVNKNQTSNVPQMEVAKSQPASANNNDSNNNGNNNGKKINLMPDVKDKPKKNVFGFLNKNKNNNANKNNALDVLGSLPPGISERDFYKKYWIEAGKIGEGAFARVRKITRKTDKAVFALKMIKKKGKSVEDIAALQREILVLQKCKHPNIVKLGDWCDTKKRIYMVVEFCDGGDVFERVVQYKKFSEKSAIHVVQQVASGLQHVHAMGYVHRDLKPDNLMYLEKSLDSEIKIIDFGLAGDTNLGPCKTPCGTAHYAAPEVLSSKPYGIEADLWSLGVIIYTLLCGFPPFFDASNNMKNLYHMIKQGKYSFPSPFWDDITEPAKDLISKLLVLDPKDRLDADQVMKHEWIINVEDAQTKELGKSYVKQMQHWQSKRQETEFGLGDENNPPPPPPEAPINIFYNKEQK